eukprot:CFRG0530T1
MFFFNEHGQLLTSEYYFKTTMGITSAIATAISLRKLLPERTQPLTGVIVASEIVCINWFLDVMLFVYFGLGEYTLATYAEKIGLGYVTMIPMGWLAGAMSNSIKYKK